jgi:predicted phage-related endonuclease
MSGRGYLGGGDIAAVCGIDPRRTPLDAYAHITGEFAVGESVVDREFFDRRKGWEPAANAIFEQKMGVKIVRANKRYTDQHHAHFKAEIDFETQGGYNGETKTLRADMRYLWDEPVIGTEEPPEYVTCQVAWGLGVHPADGCHVHALDLDTSWFYFVPRDEETIMIVRDHAARFWKNHVEKRRPPLPQDVDDLNRLYGRGTQRTVEASPEIVEALSARAKAKNLRTIQDAAMSSATLEIQKFMRDASVLTINGKTVATWKADSRGIRSFRTP